MSIIRFSNGVSVNFNGTPTQADIEEVAASVGGQGLPQSPEKKSQVSNYWNNQENGLLPYGAINQNLSPTPIPSGASIGQSFKAFPGNYAKSALKAGIGFAGFLDPISNIKKIVETGKAVKGYGSDIFNTQQSQNQLGQMNQQLIQQIARNKAMGKDTSQLEQVLQQNTGQKKFSPLTALASQAPKAAYQSLTPPAIQQGISAGLETKKSGGTIGRSLLEGLAGGLKSSAEDPGQWLPAILLGEKALGGTKFGQAIEKGVSTISSPIQKPVNYLVNKLKPSFMTKSAEQMQTEKTTRGLETQNKNLATADKAFKKNTKTYTDPDTGEQVTVTPADTLAKYKIKPEVQSGKIQMGDYQNGQGPLGEIKNKVSGLDAKITSKLTKAEGGMDISVEGFRQMAIDKAMADPYLREAAAVESTIGKINSRFDDYSRSYEGGFSVSDVNGIRKTMNSPKYWNPAEVDVNGIIGDAARDIVYQSSPKVQGLLREQGNLLGAKKYMETLNGKAVKGGRLGNYTGQVVGAIAGTGGKIPIISPLLGALGGDYVARALQRLQFNSPMASIKGSGLSQSLMKVLSKVK